MASGNPSRRRQMAAFAMRSSSAISARWRCNCSYVWRKSAVAPNAGSRSTLDALSGGSESTSSLKSVLGAKAQWRTARRQDRQGRTRVNQFGEISSRIHDLLEIVEHQQHRRRPDPPDDHILAGASRILDESKRRSDGGHRHIRIAQRRERNVDDLSREPAQHANGELPNE